jgi:hypothetical protein
LRRPEDLVGHTGLPVLGVLRKVDPRAVVTGNVYSGPDVRRLTAHLLRNSTPGAAGAVHVFAATAAPTDSISAAGQVAAAAARLGLEVVLVSLGPGDPFRFVALAHGPRPRHSAPQPRPSKIHGLSVLSLGGSDRMGALAESRDVLGDLAKRFWVVVAAPPLADFPEVAVLAGEADSLTLVCSADRMDRDDIAEAVTISRETRPRSLAWVVESGRSRSRHLHPSAPGERDGESAWSPDETRGVPGQYGDPDRERAES